MTAYYNEFDPQAAEWLRELIRGGYIAPGVVDERSILDVSADDLSEFTQCHFFAGIGGWSYALRLAEWSDDRPVWTGSPPCQPFSVVGEGKGKSDDRHLAPHFIDLVGAARPTVLFGEQVASAAVFGKVAGKAKRGDAKAPDWAWFDDLSDRLEAAHYAVGASDIPAAGVGAPHIRQRTFFGAYDLRSAAGGMADADSAAGRENPGSPSCDEKTHGRAGWFGGKPVSDNRPASDGEDHQASPLDGFWANADWLFCRDGKWRPVEPGSQPLASGVSGRVGLLRGYGNAICPWAAKAFIETFEEVRNGDDT